MVGSFKFFQKVALAQNVLQMWVATTHGIVSIRRIVSLSILAFSANPKAGEEELGAI